MPAVADAVIFAEGAEGQGRAHGRHGRIGQDDARVPTWRRSSYREPFLGLNVDHGVSLALLCEDDADDAHRMLVRLANHFSAPLGRFPGLPLPGRRRRRQRSGRPPPQWPRRANQASTNDGSNSSATSKATLQILDNTRHVCAINENDGNEVTAAWSLMHGLGRPTGATTLLLGHTPKSGNAEFSGNAAWENVARVRLFLGPVATEQGEERSRTIRAASSAGARPTPTVRPAWIWCGTVAPSGWSTRSWQPMATGSPARCATGKRSRASSTRWRG